MDGFPATVGPVAGAAFFFLLREGLSRYFTEYYLIPVGIIFTAMVIFMPQGILGFLDGSRLDIGSHRQRHRPWTLDPVQGRVLEHAHHVDRAAQGPWNVPDALLPQHRHVEPHYGGWGGYRSSYSRGGWGYRPMPRYR